MKSRTSFCNAAVLKRTLVKGLPLWGTYLLIWLFVLPIMLYSGNRWQDGIRIREYLLTIAAGASQPVGAFYGLGAAAMVFLYLYKSRTANFFASLPLTRGEMFRTNFVAGLLFAVVPHLIVVVLCIPAALAWGMFLVKDLAIWFVVMTLVFLFYYTLAVLLAMIVSNLVALPILFFVLNFTAVVIEAVVRSLLSYFIYGYYFRGSMRFDWASPLYLTVFEGNGMNVSGVWDSVSMTNVDYYITGWNIVWIMAVVSLVFLAAAYAVHHFRRMESAGDVIAVRRLKPVFLYCFTIGCSIVLGSLMAELLLESQINSNDFLVVLICLLAGSFLGYFAGQMMLHKSLRVFHKRHWRNWAVVGVLIAVVMLGVRLDIMGYASYVPETAEIKSVSVMGGEETLTSDPELIEQVRALHQDCLRYQSEIERAEDNGMMARMYLDYILTDGTRVSRQYPAPMNLAVSEELVRQYEDIVNDPDYKVQRVLPQNYTEAEIVFCSIYNYRKETEVVLSRQEAYQFLKTCLEPDLRETSMESRYWLDEPTMEADVATSSVAEVQKEAVSEYKYGESRYTSINIQIEFSRKLGEDPNYGTRYCYFDVTTDADRVLAFAVDHGIEPTLEGE